MGEKEGCKARFTAPDARILIVDDNRVNLKLAKGLFRPYHMQVETASSGEQAVEMVRDGVYNLVFMDYMMPGMNGADTAKMLRNMEGEQYKDMVIVALSANEEEGIRELCLEAGMDDFLRKPVKRHCLDKILWKWLPADMIIPGQESSGEGLTDKGREDLSVCQMDGIDMEIGMSYSDHDRTLYLEVLTDFADSIEERAGRMERALQERDLTAYTLEVHSLKSAARYLGAVAVADRAQMLEADAKRNDWQTVERETPGFLSDYRKLYESIAPYRINRAYTGKKKGFDRKELLALLEMLWQCMDEYDIDGGEEAVRALEEYELGKAWSGRRDRIVKAVDQFDYEVCKEEVLSWKAALEKEL